MFLELEMLVNRFRCLPGWGRWSLSGAALAVLCGLCWPWSTPCTMEGRLKFTNPGLVVIEAPGPGLITDLNCGEGDLLQAGQPYFTWQGQSGPYPAGRMSSSVVAPGTGNPVPYAIVYSPSAGPGNYAGDVYANYNTEEQNIRARYRKLVEEANANIRSCQDYVGQTMRDMYGRRSSPAEVEMAQRTLQRAQAAPQELNQKMEQELAAMRSTRDLVIKGLQGSQAQAPRAAGDQTMAAEGPVLVWNWLVKAGDRVQVHQPCLTILPQSSEIRLLGLLPEALRGLVPAGTAAWTGFHPFLQDEVEMPLVVESVASRVLDKDEVACLSSDPHVGGPFVLVTLKARDGDHPLFPPPKQCVISLKTPRFSILGRLLNRLTR